MKFRIKEVVDVAGGKRFYPQYRGWSTLGSWCSFIKYSGWCDADPVEFVNEPQCVHFIEQQIADMKAATVAKVNYIPFP